MLNICSFKVLTISSDALESAGGGPSGGSGSNMIDEDKDEDETAGDDVEFTTGEETRDSIQPRWPTRVFAAECLRKIIEGKSLKALKPFAKMFAISYLVSVLDCCQGNRAHYDLGLAKEMQLTQSRGCDYLVLHLSELVRVAFIAATSESDPLRLEGLRTLEVSRQAKK